MTTCDNNKCEHNSHYQTSESYWKFGNCNVEPVIKKQDVGANYYCEVETIVCTTCTNL